MDAVAADALHKWLEIAGDLRPTCLNPNVFDDVIALQSARWSMHTMNTLFPGRDSYEGPTIGTFGFLHHRILCESSVNVMERVQYVTDNKVSEEVSIRLHNMICLNECPEAEEYAELRNFYWDQHDSLWYKHHAVLNTTPQAELEEVQEEQWREKSEFNRAHKAKLAELSIPIMAYVERFMPDHSWNGFELDFVIGSLK